MQLAAIRSIAPGAVIGHGTIQTWDDRTKQPLQHAVDITAGAVLATGIRDIRAGAMQLIQHARTTTDHSNDGAVAFVRTGDTWDAVAMLAPQGADSRLTQLWMPEDIVRLQVAPGVQLDAIWQVSDYGYDAKWHS